METDRRIHIQKEMASKAILPGCHSLLHNRKNVVPEQYSDYEAESKGFYKPVIPSSRKEAFPESSLYFKDSEYINRKWRMATEDSRITQGFTSFLKELYYYLSS